MLNRLSGGSGSGTFRSVGADETRMPDQMERQRYVWALRYAGWVALFFLVLLGGLMLLFHFGGLSKAHYRGVAVAIASAYVAVSFGFARRLRSVGNFRRLFLIGVMLTMLTITATTYATGTLSSPLLVLYGPLAAGTGVYLRLRQSLWVGGLSALGLACLGVCEYVGWIPHYHLFPGADDLGLDRSLPYLIAVPPLLLAHMVAISYVSGYLAQQLGERETQLKLVDHQRWADLGQFTAVVAHEVKNPLAGIRGAAGLIEKESTSEGTKRMARAIRDEVERLNRLVTQYLEFARPREPRLVALPPVDIIRRAVAWTRSEAATNAIRVHIEVPSGLPPVRADEEQLQQVLLNLLQNARQAIGGAGDIWVTARREDGWIDFEVADSGPGIPEAVRRKIFEPFFTTRSRGSGLGLSIARRIVEAHGGTITVGSRADGGTVFRVRLRSMTA